MRWQRSSWQEIRRFCATAPASPSWALEKSLGAGACARPQAGHTAVSVLLWSSADWRQASIPQPITRPWPQAAALSLFWAPPLTKCIPRQTWRCNTRLCASTMYLAVPSRRTYPSQNFPMRNRTMALLSDATVIIEATDTSGSLAKGGKLCVSVGGYFLRNQWRKTRPWRGRPRCSITVAGSSPKRRSTACSTSSPPDRSGRAWCHSF